MKQVMNGIQMTVKVSEELKDEIENYCSTHSIPEKAMMRMALQYVIKNNIKLI